MTVIYHDLTVLGLDGFRGAIFACRGSSCGCSQMVVEAGGTWSLHRTRCQFSGWSTRWGLLGHLSLQQPQSVASWGVFTAHGSHGSRTSDVVVGLTPRAWAPGDQDRGGKAFSNFLISVLLILLAVSESWGESRLFSKVTNRGRRGSFGGHLYNCLPQSPSHWWAAYSDHFSGWRDHTTSDECLYSERWVLVSAGRGGNRWRLFFRTISCCLNGARMRACVRACALWVVFRSSLITVWLKLG